MILRNICEPQIMLTVRSCCRCGVEFRTLGERVRVCENCRRPRNPARLRVVAGQKLSDRERQVAALVARGLPNKLIASQLHLSEGTIKVYLFHIFQKTKVNNRTELAVWQVRGGPPAESQAG
jgi:DNA-binding NarL/FixJ family response regulator